MVQNMIPKTAEVLILVVIVTAVVVIHLLIIKIGYSFGNGSGTIKYTVNCSSQFRTPRFNSTGSHFYLLDLGAASVAIVSIPRDGCIWISVSW